MHVAVENLEVFRQDGELDGPALSRAEINAIESVERRHLAGLLFDGHLAEKIFDAVVDVGPAVFIDVLDSIFVEVDPSVVVDVVVGVGLQGDQA